MGARYVGSASPRLVEAAPDARTPRSRLARRAALALAAVLLAAISILGVAASRAEPATQGAGVKATPVIQSVPSPPRWFKGDDGRFHMEYELRLINAFRQPVNVASLQVLGPGARPIEALSGTQLEAAMSLLGSPDEPTTELPPSTVGIVWLDLSFATRRGVPEQIKHRLTVDVGPGLPLGPIITDTGGFAAVTRHRPALIGAPVRGPRWTAVVSVHRRGLVPVNGSIRVPQRFATDWNRLDAEGRSAFGPPDQLTSAPGYRAPLIAVADAKVVRAVDGIPELAPGEPFSGGLDQADGNHVILKLGPRTFAGYAHLVPGSVRVRRGDHVRRGQQLGRLGNSGNSTGPHLHFELMNRPSIVDADSLPFVLRRFELAGKVPSMAAFFEADRTQTPVPIDRSVAGPRRHVGLTGLEVLALPGR